MNLYNAKLKELTDSEIINHLVLTNEPLYNLNKYLEEASELNELVIKKINGKDIKDEPIIEEIGDLFIRLKILRRIFGKEKVDARIREKLQKYRGYVAERKYTGRI